MSSELSWQAVGHRLMLLRKAKGFEHQNVWATLLDAKPAQYNHWERGRQVIPVEFAVKVCSLTGATLDYIYLGNASALPMYLVSAINSPEGLLGK